MIVGNGKLSTALILIFLCVFCFSCGDSKETNEPAKFFLGYADKDITPPTGTILGGYGLPGQHRRSTGSHDPLMAQAALFSNDAGERFLIISLDVQMYFWEFGEWGHGIREVKKSIVDNLAGKVALTPEQILITNSHSHSSTDLGGLYQDIGDGVNKELLGFMRDSLSDLAVEAADKIVEIKLYFAETSLSGITARDDNCSPVLDNAVSIIQARSKENKTILTIVNFAKHPTVAPEGNTLASADFVWGYRETMKANTGAPAMFLQGFIAAVHGEHSFASLETMWDDAMKVGKALADAACDESLQFKPSARFDIAHASTLYSCEAKESYIVDTYTMFDMPKRTVLTYEDKMIVAEIPLSLHRLGDAELAAFPGEPSPEYSLMARQIMKGPFRFTVGLADDSIGYMLEPQSVADDSSGRLKSYEAKTGLGLTSGPCGWSAFEEIIKKNLKF